jgi:hypothetical protein
MKAFFDNIAHGFETIGMHPVLGAFIAGALVAFIFTRRGSRDAAAPVDHGLRAESMPASVAFKSNVSPADPVSLAVNGRNVSFPPEVMVMIRAGNKIDAIKAVRTATGLDLKDSKDVVDRLAASAR